MFNLIGTILVGFFIGLVARALHPGNDRLGFWMTAFLGIGGSFAASELGRSMGWYAPGQPAGFVSSTLGAVALLAVYSLITRSRAKR